MHAQGHRWLGPSLAHLLHGGTAQAPGIHLWAGGMRWEACQGEGVPQRSRTPQGTEMAHGEGSMTFWVPLVPLPEGVRLPALSRAHNEGMSITWCISGRVAPALCGLGAALCAGCCLLLWLATCVSCRGAVLLLQRVLILRATVGNHAMD